MNLENVKKIRGDMWKRLKGYEKISQSVRLEDIDAMDWLIDELKRRGRMVNKSV